jgi:dTDP-glucose 4,6-dehydratase
MRVLVTGGAGFLGSYFVRDWIEAGRGELLNLDLLTYAGSLHRVEDVAGDPRYHHVQVDVADQRKVTEICRGFRPDVIVHFAAESHVTRSEEDPERFWRTNTEGTRVMLEAASASGVSRFVHISTDEVYGPLPHGHFQEQDKLPGDAQATSPYAKSKAVADDLAQSFSGVQELVVLRPTNCFGAWQYPEKAFARWVTRALAGQPVLVWGDGHYVRQWLHAGDLAKAILLVLDAASPKRVYNVGPRHSPEIRNRDLAAWLLEYLGFSEDRLVFTDYDRPGHDERYAVDPTRIEALGWSPGDVWPQFAETVEWYRASSAWWTPLVQEAESIYDDAEARR